MPIAPHKFLSGGNLIIGFTVALVNAISLFASFVLFKLLSFVVFLFLMGGGALVSFAALRSSKQTALYVGFVQYPFGSGFFLMLLGILNLGTGDVGFVVGWFAIVWGFFNMVMHFWLKTVNAAVHVPLTNPGAGAMGGNQI